MRIARSKGYGLIPVGRPGTFITPLSIPPGKIGRFMIPQPIRQKKTRRSLISSPTPCGKI